MATLTTIESHVDGDEFTAAMWAELQTDINNGIVTQLGADTSLPTTQSIPNNTATAITFTTLVQDADSMWSGSTPTRLTCQTAGWFLVTGSLDYAANSTGARAVFIHKNGSGTYLNQYRPAAGGGTSDFLTVSGALYLNAGDYVEVIATQTSGGALNVTTAELVAVRL